MTPLGEGLVVSPADGRVQMIAQALPPEELELGSLPLPRISIFLNVFDVHINRIPVDGRVDVFLPAGVAPLVAVGQRAIGGETVLADLTSQAPPRAGEVR